MKSKTSLNNIKNENMDEKKKKLLLFLQNVKFTRNY